MLLQTHDATPVVPVHIQGTFAAWPMHRRLPRWHRVRVRFGAPEKPDALAERGQGEELRERIASGLRERVRELADRSA